MSKSLPGGAYGVDKEQIQAVLGELKKKMEEENVVAEEDDNDDDDEVIDEEYETDEEEDSWEKSRRCQCMLPNARPYMKTAYPIVDYVPFFLFWVC